MKPRQLFAEAGSVRLLVDCRWQSDRYQHSLIAQRGGSAVTLLQSQEGNSEEAWPPSPPLQELTPSDPNLLLGVGMAGKSHWSIAIEGTTDSIIWDVACRCREEPERIGTHYSIESDFEFFRDTTLRFAFDQVLIEVSQLDDTRLAIDGRSINFCPPNSDTSTTQRWRYQASILTLPMG